jgi:hypothetical protein
MSGGSGAQDRGIQYGCACRRNHTVTAGTATRAVWALRGEGQTIEGLGLRVYGFLVYIEFRV